jgi:hypothetical protein
MDLPQGMTISLHVGVTVQEATAARVAAVIGGASAHETVAGKQFEAELAEALADDTIAKAAYKPLGQSSTESTAADIDMFELLKAKVLASETIYFRGTLEGPAFALHVAMIERLAHETESAINVTYIS